MVRARALAAVVLSTFAGALAGVPAMSTAHAQTADADITTMSGPTLLGDYIHFVRIDRFDVAAAMARELLGRGLDPREFVTIVSDLRDPAAFEQVTARALRFPQLESVASQLDSLYRQGLLDQARDADQIARNIELLRGGVRGRILGRERLVAAGEYAMPQLMEAFLQGADSNLRAQVQNVLIALGRQAVTPLAVSLEDLDPARQELVANVLGLINYRSAVPALTELHQGTSSNAVRRATARAIERLGGDPSADVASLYASLAEGYYGEREELTSFPGEEFQLYWEFDAGVGTVFSIPLRTEIYHEAMSMRYAARSLERSNRDEQTLALWLSANFSREIDTLAGYSNPLYPENRRPASYFAARAGAEISQLVLARALEDNDTPLARRAIVAIDLTAGGQTLWQGDDGQPRPLVSALTFPNRRVQYEAALALGKSQPQNYFEGAGRVVPTLAGAIRDASARYAVVLASDEESYQSRRELLESAGFQVLPTARRLIEIAEPIAEAPAIDLILTDLTADATLAEIENARADRKLEATPVLSLSDAAGFDDLRARFRRDTSVLVRRLGISEDEILVSSRDLLDRAVGGTIDAAEAADYADRALGVLRDLAVERNAILSVEESAGPLISALGRSSGSTATSVADVLSRIGQSRAQQALMDAASDASGGWRLELLAFVGESGKRFGNLLETRQQRRLVQFAESGNTDLATTAAAAVGAMGLGIENDDLIPSVVEATRREVLR